MESGAALSITETARLIKLEDTIERGLATFVDVGTALMEIRDGRLYRERWGTFEDYCRERWGIARRTAYQLMDAAEVVENVRNCAQIAPANEAQARPLTSLPADLQPIVWQQAVETAPDGKLTAAHVEAVAAPYKNGGTPHVSFNSGNNEWYTPREYTDAARAVMGEIDLDPASSDIANALVDAGEYYTIEDDGLRQPWYGRVWMNPPYASEFVGKFIGKLVEHYSNGDVEQAIVLVNNATETGWFRNLVGVASAVVFPESRVKFWQPSGEIGAPLQGQAVVYLGDNARLFLNSFRQFGWGALIDG
jgi:ParB family chromosome partitioning protein